MGEHRSFNEQRTTICVHHHHFGVPNGLRRCGDDPILVDRIARLKDNCAPMDIHYHHVYHCGIIICIIIKQSLGSFFTLHKWDLHVAFIVLLWYVSQLPHVLYIRLLQQCMCALKTWDKSSFGWCDTKVKVHCPWMSTVQLFVLLTLLTEQSHDSYTTMPPTLPIILIPFIYIISVFLIFIKITKTFPRSADWSFAKKSNYMGAN